MPHPPLPCSTPTLFHPWPSLPPPTWTYRVYGGCWHMKWAAYHMNTYSAYIFWGFALYNSWKHHKPPENMVAVLIGLGCLSCMDVAANHHFWQGVSTFNNYITGRYLSCEHPCPELLPMLNFALSYNCCRYTSSGNKITTLLWWFDFLATSHYAHLAQSYACPFRNKSHVGLIPRRVYIGLHTPKPREPFLEINKNYKPNAALQWTIVNYNLQINGYQGIYHNGRLHFTVTVSVPS